jgi:hypothetical protein
VSFVNTEIDFPVTVFDSITKLMTPDARVHEPQSLLINQMLFIHNLYSTDQCMAFKHSKWAQGVPFGSS